MLTRRQVHQRGAGRGQSYLLAADLQLERHRPDPARATSSGVHQYVAAAGAQHESSHAAARTKENPLLGKRHARQRLGLDQLPALGDAAQEHGAVVVAGYLVFRALNRIALLVNDVDFDRIEEDLKTNGVGVLFGCFRLTEAEAVGAGLLEAVAYPSAVAWGGQTLARSVGLLHPHQQLLGAVAVVDAYRNRRRPVALFDREGELPLLAVHVVGLHRARGHLQEGLGRVGHQLESQGVLAVAKELYLYQVVARGQSAVHQLVPTMGLDPEPAAQADLPFVVENTDERLEGSIALVVTLIAQLVRGAVVLGIEARRKDAQFDLGLLGNSQHQIQLGTLPTQLGTGNHQRSIAHLPDCYGQSGYDGQQHQNDPQAPHGYLQRTSGSVSAALPSSS